MSALSKEEFMSRLNKLVGDDASDEALSIIEDFTDTYNELESKSADPENWKEKYETNDKEWREKYRKRFFDVGTTPESVKDEQNEDVKDDAESDSLSYNDLFEEREG